MALFALDILIIPGFPSFELRLVFKGKSSESNAPGTNFSLIGASRIHATIMLVIQSASWDGGTTYIGKVLQSRKPQIVSYRLYCCCHTFFTSCTGWPFLLNVTTFFEKLQVRIVVLCYFYTSTKCCQFIPIHNLMPSRYR